MSNGQTNLFDDVLKTDEKFVIVVQGVYEKHNQIIKRFYVSIQDSIVLQ